MLTRLTGGNSRHPHAQFHAVADPHQRVGATIHMERRADHVPLPSFDDYLGCRPRPRLSVDDFAARHGADPAIAAALAAHCAGHGLSVEDIHLGRRAIRLTGSVAQFDAAFDITIAHYQAPHPVHGSHIFRSHGPVGLPSALAPHVIGVFGLDNEHQPQSVARVALNEPIPATTSTLSPPNTLSLTPQKIATAYGALSNPATGQVIGIWGWNQEAADISATLTAWGLNPTPPTTFIFVNGASQDATATEGEGVLDNVAAAGMAPGAQLVIYFPDTQFGSAWVDTIGRMVHPSPGDALVDVISLSVIYTGNIEGNNPAFVRAAESLWEDAAAQSISVFSATGDAGASNYATDGGVYAAFPCVSPWITNTGGTVIGDIQGDGTIFTEWAWYGSGGGVSTLLPQPSYQQGQGLPVSLANGFQGRAYPDIAAPASPQSGMDVYVHGVLQVHAGNGTSCSAPLCAGMFATLNAALGYNVGFLNPTFYSMRNFLFRAAAVTTAGGFFTDNHNNQWGLATGLGLQVTFMGAIDGNTANVIYLLYSRHLDRLWHENSAGSWFTKLATNTAAGGWTFVPRSPIPSLLCLRDMDGSAGDQDNAVGTSPGYPVKVGWDAVTGFGPPNMGAIYDYLLNFGPIALDEVWVRVQAHTATLDGPLSDVIGPVVID